MRGSRLLCTLGAALGAVACGRGAGAPPDLILATTTSVYETGLLDSLLARFTAESGVGVKPISVGSGAALAMAARGDADVVLSHDPAAERRAVEAGYLLPGRRVMHNDFLIVGPAEDPADVGGTASLDEAMRRLAEAGEFVSRGDGSGTESREAQLWKAAGRDTAQLDRRIETGQGMSATLYVANERGAYTLVDRGTWLTLRGRVALAPLLEGDVRLLNVYSAFPVNPSRHPTVQPDPARRLVDFLVAPATQAYIGEFARERLGGQLFVPSADG